MKVKFLHYNQFNAIAWKEYRQLRSIIVTLSLLSLIHISLCFYFTHPDEPIGYGQNTMIVITIIMMPILAFFLGAGARIVEHANRLGSFLRLRPIPLKSLLAYYLGVGIFGYFFWLSLYLVVQVTFFGSEIFCWYSGHSQNSGYPLLSYLNISVLFFALYSIAFCTGMLIPNYLACSGICWSVYGLVFYFLISDRWMELEFWRGELLPFSFYALFIIPIPVLLYGTYRLILEYQEGNW